jgi:anti-anti-sigma factor
VHKVSTERRSGAAIVRGAGELDAFAAPDLESALDDALGEPAVVIDLGAVSFMDSTALGAVVRASRVLSEASSRVRIVLPSGPARRIFEITALDGVLPVSESCAVALREAAG